MNKFLFRSAIATLAAIPASIAILLGVAVLGLAQSTGGGGGGGGGGGTPCTITALSIQYNNAGAFGCVTPLTWNGSTLTDNANSALSAAVLQFTGAPVTGGTGTTTFPFIYFNQGATAVTTFNTAGTEIGINAPSTFTGYFLDFFINGATDVFNVTANGAVNAGAIGGTTITANGNLVLSPSGGNSNFLIGSSGNSLANAQNPTGVSGTGMGTSPTINWCNASFICDISVGTAPAASTWTLTFASATGHAWSCPAQDITTISASNFYTRLSGGSTTTAVFTPESDTATTGTYTAADHIRVGPCTGG